MWVDPQPRTLFECPWLTVPLGEKWLYAAEHGDSEYLGEIASVALGLSSDNGQSAGLMSGGLRW